VHGLIRRVMPALLWSQGDKDVSDEGMLDYMLPDVKGKRILRCVCVQLVLGFLRLLQRASLHDCVPALQSPTWSHAVAQ
jgi:hypothetical protein